MAGSRTSHGIETPSRTHRIVSRSKVLTSGWWPLVKQTLADWWEDKAPRLGAALAFYTVLSLAPLLVIVTPILGVFLGNPDAARQGISRQFEQLVGTEGAMAIDTMLQNPEAVVTGAAVSATTVSSTLPAAGSSPTAGTSAAKPPEKPAGMRLGRFAWILSFLVLAFGATNVFAELQDSLNTIWEVTAKPGRAAVWDFVRQRLLSFAMVMAICFLLLVSLVFTTILEALQAYLANTGLEATTRLWKLANNGLSFAVVFLLFLLIYKVLPDVTLRWRDVAVGALLTAILFTIGRHLIGQYLGRAGVGQRYGAGGSLVALLVWVYYSAQILLLGAEFTKVWSRRHNASIVPTENAIPITEETRAQMGIAHKEVVQAVTEVVERKDNEGEMEPGKEIRLEDKGHS
jgi:membrane protein